MKIFLALVFVSATLMSCLREPAADSTPEIRVEVKATTVRLGSIEETVSATGSTTIQREAQLRSPITGVIVSFKLYNGDKVKKGETVAEVRTKESQASLQGAEELLRSAVTPQQRDEAQKAMHLAEGTANTISIRATFDGILSNKSKNEVEVVSEGDQIATLVDPSSIIFLADVPSSSMSRIKESQQATIQFTTKRGKTFHGVVHRIEPQVNPNDQTARVQIVFTESNNDLEGSLFGETSIVVGRRENVLLVPAAALLRDDENNITDIMLVGSDSLAHKINVTVGVKRDSMAEISSSNVSAGNIVITEGHYGLPDSTKVRVVH